MVQTVNLELFGHALVEGSEAAKTWTCPISLPNLRRRLSHVGEVNDDEYKAAYSLQPC